LNRTFDFHEYAGFIIPGAVLTLGILLFFPDARAPFTKDGITFGELGLFVVVAYAAGQLVQGIGNLIEWLWWKPWGGIPSKRVLAGHYLSPDQRKRLIEALKKDPKVNRDLATADKAEYGGIVREVYAIISGAGKAARIDTFNGNYGLLRGLAAAFIALIAIALVLDKDLYIVGALVILLALAIQRMHRVSVHYATELFTQYLLLRAEYSALATDADATYAAKRPNRREGSVAFGVPGAVT
jgi:hypothetical protein